MSEEEKNKIKADNLNLNNDPSPSEDAPTSDPSAEDLAADRPKNPGQSAAPRVSEQNQAAQMNAAILEDANTITSMGKIIIINICLLFLISLYIFFVVILQFGVRSDEEPSIFLVTIIAGASGAMISSLSRIMSTGEFSQGIAHRLKGIDQITIAIYSLVPLVIGMVSAAVLYLIFAGGILEGALFPKFKCYDDAGSFGAVCDDLSSVVENLMPESGAGYAKLIFWGFVAGFSERLVPSYIDQLLASGIIKQKDPS